MVSDEDLQLGGTFPRTPRGDGLRAAADICIKSLLRDEDDYSHGYNAALTTLRANLLAAADGADGNPLNAVQVLALKMADENSRLRDCVRELCKCIRGWEQRCSIAHDQDVYSGNVTATMLEAMEELAGQPSPDMEDAFPPAFAVGQRVEVHGIGPDGNQSLNGQIGTVAKLFTGSRYLGHDTHGRVIVWKYIVDLDGFSRDEDDRRYFVAENLRLTDQSDTNPPST